MGRNAAEVADLARRPHNPTTVVGEAARHRQRRVAARAGGEDAAGPSGRDDQARSRALGALETAGVVVAGTAAAAHWTGAAGGRGRVRGHQSHDATGKPTTKSATATELVPASAASHDALSGGTLVHVQMLGLVVAAACGWIARVRTSRTPPPAEEPAVAATTTNASAAELEREVRRLARQVSKSAVRQRVSRRDAQRQIEAQADALRDADEAMRTLGAEFRTLRGEIAHMYGVMGALESVVRAQVSPAAPALTRARPHHPIPSPTPFSLTPASLAGAFDRGGRSGCGAKGSAARWCRGLGCASKRGAGRAAWQPPATRGLRGAAKEGHFGKSEREWERGGERERKRTPSRRLRGACAIRKRAPRRGSHASQSPARRNCRASEGGAPLRHGGHGVEDVRVLAKLPAILGAFTA